jgi:hypothetical protein
MIVLELTPLALFALIFVGGFLWELGRWAARRVVWVGLRLYSKGGQRDGR